jgi:FSR family fosmidomycin resistance protein-like MFS transporter
MSTGLQQLREQERQAKEGTVFPILGAISASHMLNDLIQSLLPAIYPLLKSSYHLDFAKIGLITLTNQITASLLQPVVGYFTDRKPQPYSLPFGMSVSLIGLVTLAYATSFPVILLAAGLVGVGSAVFHPEASRVGRMASGGQHGLAQSVFQVGGNSGSALGPLLAAFIVLPHGQHSIAWFTIAALTGILLLTQVGRWYAQREAFAGALKRKAQHIGHSLSPAKVNASLAILGALIFSKFFYLASISSYFTFYLINKFHVSTQSAEIHLFAFLGSTAVGTFIGGPVGDRIGRKRVIWTSILGVLPFTLLLPWVNLFWTGILSVVVGLILSSAFSAIVVYAQELMPGRVGMVSGLFFGFAFGMGGLGAAVLGRLADATSIYFVYQVCAWLPAIGLLTGFLPEMEAKTRQSARA